MRLRSRVLVGGACILMQASIIIHGMTKMGTTHTAIIALALMFPDVVHTVVIQMATAVTAIHR